MNHINIKGFILVLIVISLVQENVKGGPNITQKICIRKIKASYEVKEKETPLPVYYAIYGMKYIRICEETLSGIKIVPSEVGRHENLLLENTQGQTSRVSHKQVYELKDLIGNTDLNKNTSEAGGSSGSMEESSKRRKSDNTVVDYFNIPEDVKKFYMTFIPFLTNTSNFPTPSQYCWTFVPENFDTCCKQISKTFNITDDLECKDVIIKIYKHYVIGELFSKSQEYAIEYLKKIAENIQLEHEGGPETLLSPFRYCQKTYPATKKPSTQE